MTQPRETVNNIKIKALEDRIELSDSHNQQRHDEIKAILGQMSNILLELSKESTESRTKIDFIEKQIDIMQSIQRETDKDLTDVKISTKEKLSITGLSTVASTILSHFIGKI
jgi:hypothetical protein